MSYQKTIALAVLAAASAVLLAACGGAAPAPAPTNDAATAIDGRVSLLSGSARSNNAPAGTGDWANPRGGPAPTGADAQVAERWVELDISSAGDLDPVMVNGAGLTLYRFDKDTARPSVSNCFDECALAWPPLLVTEGSRVHIDPKLDRKLVGFIPRGDRTFQVTLAGWPLYRFAKDTAPGDTRGQGVNGTWFGITPDGKRAGTETNTNADRPRNRGNADATRPNAAPANTATSAILFDDARFSDNGASQGVSNSDADAGCVNVARPGVTSSVTASGTYTLWTAADCKGESLKLEGNVADLAKTGFDDKVRSIKLAPAGN